VIKSARGVSIACGHRRGVMPEHDVIGQKKKQ
jgi:hypothetical protein